MPSIPKPILTKFTQDWQKRLDQARQLNIPASDFMPVYNLDYNRMLNDGSTPYSNQAAWTAIESLQQGHSIQQVPNGPTGGGIVGKIGGFFNNVKNDVQDLVTGLYPLPAKVAEGIKQGAEGLYHAPAQSLEEFPGQFEQYISGPVVNNIRQLANFHSSQSSSLKDVLQQYDNSPFWKYFPGVTDAYQATTPTGRQWLGQHPISTLLDMAGTGDLVRVGADIAEKAGAHSLATNLRTAAQFRPLSTVGKRVSRYTGFSKVLHTSATKLGISKDLTDHLTEPFSVVGNKHQQLLNQIIEPLTDQLKIFNSKEQSDLWNLVTHNKWSDGRRVNLPDVANDTLIPQKFKDAIPTIQRAVDTYTHEMEARGRITNLVNPLTKKSEWVPTLTPRGKTGELVRNPIVRTINKYDSRVTAAHDIAKTYGELKLLHQSILDHLSNKLHPFPITLDESKLSKDMHWQYSPSMIIRQFQSYFQELDPKSFIVPKSGWTSKDIGAAVRRYKDLWADGGSIQRLTDDLDNSNFDLVKKDITSLHRSLSSLSYKQVAQVTELRSVLSMLQSDIRDLQKLEPKMLRGSVALRVARERLDESIKEINSKWAKNTARRHEEYIKELVEEGVSKLALEKGDLDIVDQPTLDIVLKDIGNKMLNPMVDGEPIFSTIEMNKIRDSAIEEFQNSANAGMTYLWIPKAPSERFQANVRISATHNIVPDAAKKSSMNLSNSIESPFLGLIHANAQMYSDDATREYFDLHVRDRLSAGSDLVSHYQDEYHGRYINDRNPPSMSHYIEQAINRDHWKKFDFDKFVQGRSSSINPFTGPGEFYIQESDLNHLDNLTRYFQNSLLDGYDKSLNVFRFSVLGLSPRFAAHITFGGGFLLIANTGPGVFRYLPSAIKLIKNKEIPTEMSRGFATEADIYNPVKWHNYFGGQKMFDLGAENMAHRLGIDKAAAAVNFYQSALHTVSEAYRVMAYLYGKDSSKLRNNLSSDELTMAAKYGRTPSEFAGIKLANKTFADLNRHSPLERSILKRIFPFYGWTKHIIKFTLSFPIDHPLRANILANLSNQAIEENSFNIPTYLYHLFFLGQPDVNGNVSTIDIRAWNPIRDIANYMTTAGFIGALNPLVQGLLNAFGVDTTTGGPQLYPELNYSSFYGSNQTTSAPGTTPLSIIQSYVPETGVIDHFLKLSTYTKTLAKYDPRAYQQQFWSSINVPWVPQEYNLQQLRAKEATTQFYDAESAVKTALSSNNPDAIKGYGNFVPYNGWEISSAAIIELINQTKTYNQQHGTKYNAIDLVTTPIPPSEPLPVLQTNNP